MCDLYDDFLDDLIDDDMSVDEFKYWLGYFMRQVPSLESYVLFHAREEISPRVTRDGYIQGASECYMSRDERLMFFRDLAENVGKFREFLNNEEDRELQVANMDNDEYHAYLWREEERGALDSM